MESPHLEVSKAGQVLEHPDLAEGVPVHGRGVEWDELYGPLQPKPVWDFCDVMWKR